MKHTRQNTYVERELARRKAMKRQRIIDKAVNGLAGFALVIGAEVFMFALFLM